MGHVLVCRRAVPRATGTRNVPSHHETSKGNSGCYTLLLPCYGGCESDTTGEIPAASHATPVCDEPLRLLRFRCDITRRESLAYLTPVLRSTSATASFTLIFC